MDIRFSGKYAANSQTFGINFEAIVDGKSLSCSVSTEALEDADPSLRNSGTEEQFVANRSVFESIARRKIVDGLLPVQIVSADLR
ncbi:DUF1488 domain-containing protein [Tahibacter soli]|uniref:DUF1488 domain-containing protein n=1 Tax=Tahibacter soli TaxID=2983605 RepID=A0A9X4BGE3_9GAMM|nr:DUF1488 domain-containing protein [Tahibacter soli]MDC8010963.1 DUF1488 domain-containing protein [Tahibacter soli]